MITIEINQRPDFADHPPDQQWRILIVDDANPAQRVFMFEVVTAQWLQTLVKEINRASRDGAPWPQLKKVE